MGGYSPADCAYCGRCIVGEVAGIRAGLEDPLLDLLGAFGGQERQAHQDAVIERAAQLATALGAPTSQT